MTETVYSTYFNDSTITRMKFNNFLTAETYDEPSKKDVDKSKSTKDSKSNTVGYFSLYRYATKWEILLISLGVLAAVTKALVTPLMIIIYSEFTTLLVDRTYAQGTSTKTNILEIFGGGRILTNATKEENRHEILNDSIAYVISMGIVTIWHFIAGIFSVDLFNQAALGQITRIRVHFFKSLMRQEIGWYDVTTGNNVAVRITEDIERIREGIAEKVGHFVVLVMSFVICVTLSFVYGWELSLVVISYVPIVIITNIIIGKVQAKLTTRETDAYSIAANLVEEILGGIRTVVAFCGERSESERYDKLLNPARKASKRKGLASGIGDGIMRFLFFASNALAYWYGVRLVLNDRDKIDKTYTPAVLMITFFGLIVGAENIAKLSPFLEGFASARGSATTIFKVIDRKSKIDSQSNDGKIINFGVKGNIEFRNVFFSYPSRKDVPILRGINFNVKAGQTVALVGSSGNGKSTCIHLLQRFYDPSEGDVLIDDCNIKQLNISLLRSNMALVGQEPVLFSTTIGENIRYGKPDATDDEVISAAKYSGADDFISRLPEGYRTAVGEKGCQLSGGQKQRIAIARALIQNPKILLLDEATSALDYQSEKFVQRTLDKLSKGRTTIVVSHRLSAIKHADRILYIEKGQVLEDGSDSELLALKGNYYDMVASGTLDDEKHGEPDENAVNEKQKETHEKLLDKQLFRMRTHSYNQEDTEIFTEVIQDSSYETINEKAQISYWKTLKRILRLSRPEWIYLFLATIGAIIVGATPPIFAVLFGEFYGALAVEDPNEALELTHQLCILFLVVGIVMFFAAVFQTHWFNMAGVYLSTRIRSMTFSAMLKQEMGWFDDDENSVGALSARLTGDAANIQGAIGFPFSGIVQCVSTFVIGCCVSYAYSFKLSTLCLICVPLVVITVLVEAKHMGSSTLAEKKSIEDATKIATESTSNIRTIASLRQEPYMIERYVNEMEKVESVVRKKIVWRGLVNSFGQSVPFIGYTIALYYGGLMVADNEIHYKEIIKVSEALLYGSMIIGQSLVFAPAFTAAFVAGNRLFRIIDREPLIASPNIANKCRKSDHRNNIDYKSIDFRYPTRPETQILKGLNLKINEGQTIALVGPSGCGKSTLIQLLQRFYDPERGRIHIGLDEISNDITLNDLRCKLSIVSQEPVLFNRTIAENIAYGSDSRDIIMNKIIEASRIANIHNFIAALPLGYHTILGSKTTQLSGGQKQRVAIARALLRNPKILLLDEATSALDLQSEQVVQQALDSARCGRTCLIIAHRLSTVQNADVICVVRNGVIGEMGTHSQLLAAGGTYANLYHAQK